ncbi:membrane protein [Corynebacterium phocae]|uniref:Membrane protein n=1 Tax=Corynebacterium phocae TaxID=161895 RepID=A0A1L7D5S4_9CORY|nr:permease [Corynebacterium phocae]APT93343.1 membrane protein [Corynebacterium phocae]KAA8721677.1 permease [Corynebacterium phocae]
MNAYRGPLIVIAFSLAGMAFSLTWGPPLQLEGLFEAWASITVAIVMQAVPFLVFGVLVSGAISAFVSQGLLRRITPRNDFLAVPAAASAGFLLPGCECASVPVAQSLIRRKVPEAAALTFLLASPAINPVVIVSTVVAFQGHPNMAAARVVASLFAAIAVGWAWVLVGHRVPMVGALARFGHSHSQGHSHGQAGASTWEAFRAAALHDLTSAGGFLTLGAMVAALIKVTVPGQWFETIGAYPLVSCVVMALLAVALSLCSEADAFIAASFTQISPAAQLVFLVVGPMVDIKLMAMQYGAWGRRFVARFAPLTFVAALFMGLAVGAVISP